MREYKLYTFTSIFSNFVKKCSSSSILIVCAQWRKIMYPASYRISMFTKMNHNVSLKLRKWEADLTTETTTCFLGHDVVEKIITRHNGFSSFSLVDHILPIISHCHCCLHMHCACKRKNHWMLHPPTERRCNLNREKIRNEHVSLTVQGQCNVTLE